MREILFRAKRLDNGQWITGYFANVPDKSSCYILTGKVRHGNGSFDLERYAVDPETLGQFTGLFDKRGKKIFEGDIIRVEVDRLFTIQFDKGFFGAYAPPGLFYMEIGNIAELTSPLIVDNIHDFLKRNKERKANVKIEG
jgi:uncharacterized phage protein (TIGR01671 family)